MNRIKTEKFQFTRSDIEFLILQHLQGDVDVEKHGASFEWPTAEPVAHAVTVKSQIAVQTTDLKKSEMTPAMINAIENNRRLTVKQ